MCEILTYRQFRKYLHKDCLVFSGLDDQDHKKIPRLEEMTIKLCKNYTSELFKSLAFVKIKGCIVSYLYCYPWSLDISPGPSSNRCMLLSMAFPPPWHWYNAPDQSSTDHEHIILS